MMARHAPRAQLAVGRAAQEKLPDKASARTATEESQSGYESCDHERPLVEYEGNCRTMPRTERPCYWYFSYRCCW
jgi:hypothetical protein